MSTITTRAGKGSALTHTEVDDNFTNLNTDKVETSAIGTTVQAYDSNLTSFVGTFTLPTSDGSSGQVLKTDGAGALTFVDQSGGLTYFNDSEDTASPNNTRPVNALTVANSSSNVDLALIPKGSGAIVAQVPDDTVTGGKKRGIRATDFSRERSQDYEVASGNYSTVVGGRQGRASGSYSTVLGGTGSDATSYYCLSGPGNSQATGFGSVALGYAAAASGSRSTNTGYYCYADGDYSLVNGSYGDARVRDNIFVMASSIGSLQPAQTGIQNLAAQTVDATPTELKASYSASSNLYLYQNRMDTNCAYAFRILCVANVTSGGDTKAWELYGCIKRGTSGAPTLVGAVTKNIIAADSGAASWDVDFFINTTDGFSVEVTGQASTTIRWNASVFTSEIEF